MMRYKLIQLAKQLKQFILKPTELIAQHNITQRVPLICVKNSSPYIFMSAFHVVNVVVMNIENVEND